MEELNNGVQKFSNNPLLQYSIIPILRYSSSDQSIKEYRDQIWKAYPVPIKLGKYTIG